MPELSQQNISELFSTVLQHLKCIEVRTAAARALTSQKQKYALTQAVGKATNAINIICDLLGDSNMVLKVKKQLDRADLVYVMLLTEQLTQLETEELEEVVTLIDDYLQKKHSKNNN